MAVDKTQHKQLKIVVIGGSGLIGKRHCQHIASNSSCKLTGIVDPSSSAVAVAQCFGVPLYDTIQALFNESEKPDAAIVCTPNHTHISLSVKLLQSGIHVLCEKPIGIDVESCGPLLRAAKNNNVKLLVGHHRRFNPYMIATKKIVDSGILGDITAVSGLWTTTKPPDYFAGEAVSWRTSRSRGGGTILINFIHEIDLMHHLFGPVTRIHAEKVISRRKVDGPDLVEEGAALIMRFSCGIVGTFIIADNVASPHSFEHGTGENPALPKSGMDVYRIFGTEGTFSFPDMTLSSYCGGKKSWEEKMMSRKVEVDNIDIAPLRESVEPLHFRLQE